MTTARGVIAEATGRGVALSVEGDHLFWRARTGVVTQDLIEDMKLHKTEIMDALREPDPMAGQRYGRPPDCEIPLSILRPTLTDRDAELLHAFIERQPAPVVNWVCCQADRYDVAAQRWQPRAVREYAAMLDCLLWQWEHILTAPDRANRHERVQEALRNLDGNERFDRIFTQQRTAKDNENPNGAQSA